MICASVRERERERLLREKGSKERKGKANVSALVSNRSLGAGTECDLAGKLVSGGKNLGFDYIIDWISRRKIKQRWWILWWKEPRATCWSGLIGLWISRSVICAIATLRMRRSTWFFSLDFVFKLYFIYNFVTHYFVI